MELETVTVKGKMDSYEMNNILSTYSKNIEDLNYKMSVLEESVAQLTAYISELKGEADAEVN